MDCTAPPGEIRKRGQVGPPGDGDIAAHEARDTMVHIAFLRLWLQSADTP